MFRSCGGLYQKPDPREPVPRPGPFRGVLLRIWSCQAEGNAIANVVVSYSLQTTYDDIEAGANRDVHRSQ